MVVDRVPHCAIEDRDLPLSHVRCLSSAISDKKFLRPITSETIRCASDNSFQHFAELNAKAFFLRGCRCRRTVAM